MAPVTNSSEAGATADGRLPTSSQPLPTLEQILAHAPGENFPVATRLLPKRHRKDLLAIYGFARLVDDLGDEWPGDRRAALDWLSHDLDDAMAGASSHPANRAVVATLKTHGLSDEPLRRLIDANRQDQVVTRYDTFEDLVGYCRLSANPVGRLVLGVFGGSEPGQEQWSDSICTGLQLAEHWQDVVEDARAGRVYLPAEDLAIFGSSQEAVLIGLGNRDGAVISRELRAVIAFEVSRARRMILAGSELIASLHGWSRVAVLGFASGGLAALDAIADTGFRPAEVAPKVRRRRTARHVMALGLGSARMRRSATATATTAN